MDLVKANIENIRTTSEEFYRTQLAHIDEISPALNVLKAFAKPQSRWR